MPPIRACKLYASLGDVKLTDDFAREGVRLWMDSTNNGNVFDPANAPNWTRQTRVSGSTTRAKKCKYDQRKHYTTKLTRRQPANNAYVHNCAC